MRAIAAVDENCAIGRRGELLIRIPADHKRFFNMTVGKVVVYGRKTLETFPQRQPLSQRTNIILSRKKDFSVKGAIVVNDIDELFAELKKYNDDDIYIIGGESIYRQFLPYCDTAYLTEIDYKYEADKYFPRLDMNEWLLTEMSDEQYYNDITYHFAEYKRKGK